MVECKKVIYQTYFYHCIEIWEHELGVYSIVFENEFGTMQE